MDMLKLLALDEDDLTIVSATMQDAVLKIEDLNYEPGTGHFVFAANRFVWEKAKSRGSKNHERRRVHLAFKRVNGVKLRDIDRSKSDEVLSLLAIQFHQNGDGPDGQLELVMSTGAGILLDVECIEVQLTDTGGAWETRFKPHHST